MPAAGVRVVVRGNHHDYTATTNQAGKTEIRLPTGQYSVEAAGYRGFELSYEDPKKVTIENGGCAQVQFVKSENK